MSSLLGGAIPHLEAAMRFRVARQAVLSSNVAHADTPGYRRRDVERPGGFDGQLRDAGLRLDRTHARHLGTGGAGAAGDYRLVTGPRGQRPDGNGVDLESEVVKLRRNAGAFEDQATILSRLLALRRMAATADAR